MAPISPPPHGLYRGPMPSAPARATERRLVLVMSAVVFVDTLFYAVLAPLLPQLAHELHLSKLFACWRASAERVHGRAGLPGSPPRRRPSGGAR
jgi:hypothetical protein